MPTDAGKYDFVVDPSNRNSTYGLICDRVHGLRRRRGHDDIDPLVVDEVARHLSSPVGVGLTVRYSNTEGVLLAIPA